MMVALHCYQPCAWILFENENSVVMSPITICLSFLRMLISLQNTHFTSEIRRVKTSCCQLEERQEKTKGAQIPAIIVLHEPTTAPSR